LFNATCPLPKGYVDLPNAEDPIVGSIKCLLSSVQDGELVSLMNLTANNGKKHTCELRRPV